MVALRDRPLDPVDDACAFIRRHLPLVQDWPEGRLEEWWEWHWQRKLAAVIHRDGRVVAVGCARVVDTRQPATLFEPYAHVPGHGNCLFVDGVAIEPELREQLLPLMWDLLETTLGRRARVAFARSRHGGRLRIWDRERVARVLRAQALEISTHER
jgi:hypothetical protein